MSGRISARKDASNVIVSKGPDVCLTPRGNHDEPVAYSSIAKLDTAVRYSSSVRNNGRYDFQLNSRCKTSEGHEPGTHKGIEEHGYTGPAHVEAAADFFFSEGFAVVAHRDPAWINRPDQGPVEPRKGMKTVTLDGADTATAWAVVVAQCAALLSTSGQPGGGAASIAGMAGAQGVGGAGS